MGSRLRVAKRDRTQRTMALLWAAFTAAYLAFFYVFQDAREIADANLDGYLEVILLGVPSVVLLAGTMWLHESEVDADLRPRVIGWTVGMALLFTLAMYTALFVIETRFDPGEQWLILLLSMGFGASSGTVMGSQDIRSKQRERERNRSLEVARRTERKRTQLEHLNQYLRHEVLNEVNKISGYAELLADRTDIDGTDAHYLDTIRHSSEEVGVFIESIRTILDAADHDPELAPVDAMAAIEEEVRKHGRTHPSVDIEIDGPGSAYVLAGDLLNRVFRNLIKNAIEHNGDDVAIRIEVEHDGEWVRIRVRDDGSGIPAEERARLFEPPESGNHGYGLFLTRNLVEVYGGRLELEETGPSGTAFVGRFLAATTADAAASASPNATEAV